MKCSSIMNKERSVCVTALSTFYYSYCNFEKNFIGATGVRSLYIVAIFSVFYFVTPNSHRTTKRTPKI